MQYYKKDMKVQETDEVIEIKGDIRKVILVGICLESKEYNKKLKSLDELALLVDTAGLEVVGKFIQRRKSIDKTFYLGRGFLEEMRDKMYDLDAGYLVFDNELHPAQGRNILKYLKINTFDRTEIILKIFHDHAKTKEAKLQVKLAQLQYELPRLKNKWSHFENERVAAGRGGSAGGASRGMGETQTEVDRRKIKDEIAKIQKILQKNIVQLETQSKYRKSNFKLVCLVGYTNAGKSTMFNRLTNSKVYVQNQLFATLDSTSKSLNLGKGKDVILSDTVGFIADLPHHLVASFRATLKEAVDADLLIHLVDFSDPDFEKHITDVNDVLKQIGAEKIKQVLAFNKIDALDKNDRRMEFVKSRFPKAVWVSAKNNINIDKLLKAIDDTLNFAKKHVIKVPHSDQKTISLVHKLCKIINKEYLEDSVSFNVILNHDDLPYFKEYIKK